MRRVLLGGLLLAVPAQAGTPPQPHDMLGGWVVATCGADPLVAGQQGVLEVTPDGRLCVSRGAGGPAVPGTGRPPQPAGMSGAWVVATCGADPLVAGQQGVLEATPNGRLCVSP